MDDKNAFILGDSHTSALSNALKQRSHSNNFPGVIFDVRWLSVDRKDGRKNKGNLSFNDAISKTEEMRTGDLLVLTLMGTLHNVIGLLNHPEPFSLINKYDSIEGGKHCIPRAQIQDMYMSHLKRNHMVGRFVDKCKGKVIHLSVPPPKKDLSFVNERWLEKVYHGHVVREMGVNDCYTRLELWKLEKDCLSDVLAEMGCCILDCPEGTQTSEGFLKPTYYAADATHANAEYGELVLQQIEEMLL